MPSGRWQPSYLGLNVLGMILSNFAKNNIDNVFCSFDYGSVFFTIL